MYEQTEYLLAYAMVFAFLVLGMLLVCVPRPRKTGFVDPKEAAKEKRLRHLQKAKAKQKKQSERAKKKRMAKAKAKIKKK